MAIHYILRENLRTADPNDYYGVVVPTGTMTQQDFLQRMQQAGSTLGLTDMSAFLQLFFQTMLAVLLEGQTVNLSFGGFSVSLRGVFNGADDTFDATRHDFFIIIDANAALMKLLRAQVVPQKDIAALPTPIVTQFRDVISGSLNGTAKAGGPGEIKGDNMKFDTTKTDEGVFFVPATGAAVKATVISRNEPKTIAIQIPGVTAQGYTLEVRRRFGPTGPVRTGTLPVQVTGVT